VFGPKISSSLQPLGLSSITESSAIPARRTDFERDRMTTDSPFSRALPTVQTQTYVGGELEIFADAIHWKDYVRSQVAPFLGPRVLEVGAGLGGTTRVFCRGDHDAWVLLEPDPQLAAQAEQLCLSEQLPACCQVRIGTTSDLPVGEAFDAILYIDVLEHIERDLDEFRRAAGLLSPGGHLIVLSPAHQFLFSEFDRQIGHYRRYTLQSLRRLTDERLELRRARYLDALGIAASLANRVVLRRPLPTPRQVRLWDRWLVPCSRRLDGLLGYQVGKSVLGIWQRVR
jgi:2-polyprenyl-3-methyl-5-hydroxy-6-metoxy-1,4-benzoquinol methylase